MLSPEGLPGQEQGDSITSVFHSDGHMKGKYPHEFRHREFALVRERFLSRLSYLKLCDLGGHTTFNEIEDRGNAASC